MSNLNENTNNNLLNLHMHINQGPPPVLAPYPPIPIYNTNDSISNNLISNNSISNNGFDKNMQPVHDWIKVEPKTDDDAFRIHPRDLNNNVPLNNYFDMNRLPYFHYTNLNPNNTVINNPTHSNIPPNNVQSMPNNTHHQLIPPLQNNINNDMHNIRGGRMSGEKRNIQTSQSTDLTSNTSIPGMPSQKRLRSNGYIHHERSHNTGSNNNNPNNSNNPNNCNNTLHKNITVNINTPIDAEKLGKALNDD